MTGPATAFSGRIGNWRWLLYAAALGEYVVDKLPGTPPRTQPLGLAARAVASGIAGASVAGDEPALGAALAIAGAMGAAYLGVAYRREAARRKWPPFTSAALEDATAIALARFALARRPG